MIPVGQHFLDRQKLWQLAAGKTVPLVDVAYAVDPYDGFDVNTALGRLAVDCASLRRAGCTPRPYLRLDFRPGETLAPEPRYFRQLALVMATWDTYAPLTVILGNEPNHPDEGQLQPPLVAQVVERAVGLRDLLAYPVRLFAPAVAPWAPLNVDTPDDFCPGPSSEWRNQQYGIARRLADVPIDGYALHTYGRPRHPDDADEPFADQLDDRTGQQWGFRWYRDALDAIDAGDPRGLPVIIGETNTRTDAPSAQSYPAGWLPAAVRELEAHPAAGRIEGACWFVGESHGSWVDESLKERTGRLVHADDDLNTLLGRS